MTIIEAVLLVVAVVLLTFTALLSAIETVLQRLDLVRALAIDDDEPGGPDLVWIIEHRGSCLNVTLVLTVLSRITAVAIAVVLANGWWPGGAGAATAALVVAMLTLVLAEVAPRSAAMKALDRTGLRLAPLTRRMVRFVEPLARLFVVVGRAVAGARPGTSGPFASDEPASEPVVDDHEDPAELEEDERAMIRSIVELGDTIAREIMVPRPDMVIVDESERLRDLVNTVVQHGVSRVPVCRDDRDHIVGIIYAKDVLRRVALQPDRTDWADLVRPATFIPETKQIDDLLRELQAQSVHIAIVVDEYGATTGLVTIEDILEEIVGEIIDEHDHEEALVEVVDDGVWSIDARLPVDDLNALIGSDLPDDDWDTVGGLVVGALGRVPMVGDEVELDGVSFQAQRVQGRRVAKVLVQAHRPGDRTPA